VQRAAPAPTSPSLVPKTDDFHDRKTECPFPRHPTDREQLAGRGLDDASLHQEGEPGAHRGTGKRISGYVQFICAVGSLKGTSTEAKENAVTAFHERMVVAERRLGRIFEDLQLG
jgi:hypothetical protein